MKIIKIKGGLGNQMFQYAYGRSLMISGEEVVYDTSFFYGARSANDTVRHFALDEFTVDSTAQFLNLKSKNYIISKFLNALKRFFGLASDEYYQSEKYFLANADVIRKEFVLKSGLSFEASEILQKIKNNNSVSLHIRRGDYVANEKTNSYHGICGLDYYHRAQALIREKISKPTFFVFSDDIAWAKENLKGDEHVFVSTPSINDYEELMLMKECQYNIVANSSFSWWGAWLNANPDKIVIAPKQWFQDKRAKAEDIIPAAWIKI